jgi:hypothetical protein
LCEPETKPWHVTVEVEVLPKSDELENVAEATSVPGYFEINFYGPEGGFCQIT